jgi:hypothetical protein
MPGGASEGIEPSQSGVRILRPRALELSAPPPPVRLARQQRPRDIAVDLRAGALDGGDYRAERVERVIDLALAQAGEQERGGRRQWRGDALTRSRKRFAERRCAQLLRRRATQRGSMSRVVASRD